MAKVLLSVNQLLKFTNKSYQEPLRWKLGSRSPYNQGTALHNQNGTWGMVSPGTKCTGTIMYTHLKPKNLSLPLQLAFKP